MKNTLRFSLMAIGFGMLGFAIYMLLFPDSYLREQVGRENSQFYAMLGFGLLCLISGIAYKRR